MSKIVILNVIITDEEYKTNIRITSNEMDATEEEKDKLDFIKKALKVNLKANNFITEKNRKGELENGRKQRIN